MNTIANVLDIAVLLESSLRQQNPCLTAWNVNIYGVQARCLVLSTVSSIVLTLLVLKRGTRSLGLHNISFNGVLV